MSEVAGRGWREKGGQWSGLCSFPEHSFGDFGLSDPLVLLFTGARVVWDPLGTPAWAIVGDQGMALHAGSY